MKDFETTEVPSIEFIGYRIPQHKQNNCRVLFTRHQSTKGRREILVFKILFLWRPFTQHVSLTFSYSNCRCGYLDNHSEYPKSVTHFCLLILCDNLVPRAFSLACVHSFSSCCDIRYPINSLKRTSVVSTLTARSLLTKRKNRLKYTFIVNSIY